MDFEGLTRKDLLAVDRVARRLGDAHPRFAEALSAAVRLELDARESIDGAPAEFPLRSFLEPDERPSVDDGLLDESRRTLTAARDELAAVQVTGAADWLTDLLFVVRDAIKTRVASDSA